MQTLSPRQKSAATQEWVSALKNIELLDDKLFANAVFELDEETLISFINQDKYTAGTTYRFELGIHANQIVFILVPRDINGQLIEQKAYLYTPFVELKNNIPLVQGGKGTLATATLTPNMEVINLNPDDAQVEVEKPTISIPTFTERIALWKEMGRKWLLGEFHTDKCCNVFTCFYIPKESLIKNQSVHPITAFFGLKSESIEPSCPARVSLELIKHVNITPGETHLSSNIFNYAKPCPPNCQEM